MTARESVAELMENLERSVVAAKEARARRAAVCPRCGSPLLVVGTVTAVKPSREILRCRRVCGWQDAVVPCAALDCHEPAVYLGLCHGHADEEFPDDRGVEVL